MAGDSIGPTGAVGLSVSDELKPTHARALDTTLDTPSLVVVGAVICGVAAITETCCAPTNVVYGTEDTLTVVVAGADSCTVRRSGASAVDVRAALGCGVAAAELTTADRASAPAADVPAGIFGTRACLSRVALGTLVAIGGFVTGVSAAVGSPGAFFGGSSTGAAGTAVGVESSATPFASEWPVEFADVCAPPELDTIPDAGPVDDGDCEPVVEEPVDGDASAAEPDDASPAGDDVCESADGEVPVSEGSASATPWPVATAVPIPRATASPPTRAIFAADFVTVPPNVTIAKIWTCRRIAGGDLLDVSRRDAPVENVTDTGTRGGLNTKNSCVPSWAPQSVRDVMRS